MQNPQQPVQQQSIQDILKNDNGTFADTPSEAEIKANRTTLMKDQMENSNIAHDPMTGIPIPPQGADANAPPSPPLDTLTAPPAPVQPQPQQPQPIPPQQPQVQPPQPQQPQPPVPVPVDPSQQPPVPPQLTDPVQQQLSSEDTETVNRLNELMQEETQQPTSNLTVAQLEQVVMGLVQQQQLAQQQPAQINPQGFQTLPAQQQPVQNPFGFDDPLNPQPQPQPVPTDPNQQVVLASVNALSQQVQQMQADNQNAAARQQYEVNVRDLMNSNGITRDHAEKAQLYFENGHYAKGSEIVRLATQPVITRMNAAVDREVQRDASGQPLTPAMQGGVRTTPDEVRDIHQKWINIQGIQERTQKTAAAVQFVIDYPEYAAQFTEGNQTPQLQV